MSDIHPHRAVFAGIDLAARVERAERALIEESVLAAGRRDPAHPVVLLPVGSGLAAWAGADSPFSKVVGLGMGSGLGHAELDLVEDALAGVGATVQFEISTLADPEVAERLTERGYRLIGFENVLGLELRSTPRARLAPGVRVETVGPDDFEVWLEVDVEAAGTPDTQGIAAHETFPRQALERAQRDLAATTGFSATIAFLDGSPAGSAGLRLDGGIAQLCGAATLPAFRRRGVQASLLSARLAVAAGAGCDLAVVTVQPGSTSQQNVQKFGFQLLYTRAILVRPAT